MKLYLILVLFLVFFISCSSPSDEQHSCKCDYSKENESIIQGVDNYSDLELGKECDKKCGFRRLLVLFYDESDSSKNLLKIIESDQTLVNDINDNFAFVCLSTENSTENQETQRKRFNSDEQPFFAVMTAFNDSLITSFGYMDKSEKIDSILISTLY
jgi:hypothetical protein